MRFVLLMKSSEEAEAGVMPDASIVEAMGRYNDEMTRAGVLVAAEGLQPTAKGARLRYQAGQISVTDGPFAEAKEVVAGYWLIDVASKEEAVAWARRSPMGTDPAFDGTAEIEVRPLYETDDFPVNEDESGWREREVALRAEQARAAADPAPAPANALRFLMCFMADQDSEAGVLPSESLLTEMGGLMDEMARAGVLLSGDGLQPSAKGARVNFAKGRQTVTDGPFTETKELIAGFSIIRVGSHEEALDWARRGVTIDGVGRGGESEVVLRQIFEPTDFPPELLATQP